MQESKPHVALKIWLQWISWIYTCSQHSWYSRVHKMGNLQFFVSVDCCICVLHEQTEGKFEPEITLIENIQAV